MPATRMQPSIALLVGRWGGWPGWTPLLLLTMRANPTVDFFLLSDAAPDATLPPNVRFVRVTLDELLRRFRPLGCTLTSLRSRGTFSSGVSQAKVNDLKPFFGTAFAELLRPYEWWGNLQEDLVLGDLRAFATSALLARSDVVSPYTAPLNASGVLMLFRNTPVATEAWRRSSAVRRVLTSPSYLVFDEWWGALAGGDNLPRVLGREADAGRLRLSVASPQRRWMGDDKHYLGGSGPTANSDFVACWRRGGLWVNVGGKRTPCAGTRGGRRRAHGSANATAYFAPQVAVVHLSRLKRARAYAELALAAALADGAAEEFVLTRMGAWLPVSSPAGGAARHELASGLGPRGVEVASEGLSRYMRALQQRDEAARCNPRKSKRAPCRPLGEPPRPPCAVRLAGERASCEAGGRCAQVLGRLGMERCA